MELLVVSVAAKSFWKPNTSYVRSASVSSLDDWSWRCCRGGGGGGGGGGIAESVRGWWYMGEARPVPLPDDGSFR